MPHAPASRLALGVASPIVGYADGGQAAAVYHAGTQHRESEISRDGSRQKANSADLRVLFVRASMPKRIRRKIVVGVGAIIASTKR